MTEKRYYWFKMSSDFFERDDVKWVLSKRDGSDYIIIYLNLCLKSLCNGGLLFSKVGEMIIPYDSDSIFRELGGRYKESTILAAIACLKQAGLIYTCTTENCLAIANIEQYIGSESDSARRMRKMRNNQASLCYKDVTLDVTKCDVTKRNNSVTESVTSSVTLSEQENQERKSNQKERIKENKNKLKLVYLKESKSECDADVTDSVVFVLPSLKGNVEIYQSYIDDMQDTFRAVDVVSEIRKAKKWLEENPMNAKSNIRRYLYNWLSRAQDKASRVYSQNHQQQNNRIQPSMAYQTTEEIDSL